MNGDFVSEPPQRRDNGLRADQFIALADVDPRLGEHLLDLLRLAEIAAYLEPTTDPGVATRYPVSGPVERLYVESDQRQEARAVVVAAAHEAGESAAPVPETLTPDVLGSDVHGSDVHGSDVRASDIRASDVRGPDVRSPEPRVPGVPNPREDVLAGIDLDAEFARIVSGFTSPSAGPTGPATDAAREIAVNQRRLDPDDLVAGSDAYGAAEDSVAGVDDEPDDDEEHFEPPPAPPFPIPTANTVGAVLLLVLGMLVLIRGDLFGLGSGASFPTSVLLLLGGSALIIRGLRDQPDPDDEPDDDGAAV